jgi:hypothetical protein
LAHILGELVALQWTLLSKDKMILEEALNPHAKTCYDGLTFLAPPPDEADCSQLLVVESDCLYTEKNGWAEAIVPELMCC